MNTSSKTIYLNRIYILSLALSPLFIFVWSWLREFMTQEPSGALVFLFEAILICCVVVFILSFLNLYFGRHYDLAYKVFMVITSIVSALGFWAFNGFYFLGSLF